ncbi:MAG: helix-turn-helix transcriptional regulator [Selenomonadaceae bacterium]|nr:helix-turn-helix transcriptional regulator [Selenomonadaceae bacterium]
MKDKYQKQIQYIGLRIAYFRKMRDMTQVKLAEKVGINKNYLSQIESGSANKAISLPLLIQISEALDIELSVLVDLTDWDKSKKDIRKQLDEIRRIFNDAKQLNADIDSIMAEMAEFDKKF